jgi:glycosyltransferase involved in cell wall biosynthesis
MPRCMPRWRAYGPNNRMTTTEPVAIVLPWYGPDSVGGAEAHARQLAGTLRAAGVPVEVWCTTARDARAPVEPFYPEGESLDAGVVVRRFPATQGELPGLVRRDPGRFRLHEFSHHELNLLRSLTGSDALLERLQAERATRRWIFFLYAFPSSFFGAEIAVERGYLIPCLHDEPYARYGTTRHLLRRVKRVLANSHPEAALIRQLAALPAERVPVVGEGIDLGARGDGARFRRDRALEGPLVLFAGRRDHSKNFPLLLAYATEYWARHGFCFRLLVGGPGPLVVPEALREHVIDLGFLSVEQKHDAYAAADLFCMPSLLESYSIVIMEAWLQGTPVLVHGDCAVTVDQCRRSQGGLWFSRYHEFDAALTLLLEQPDLARRLGVQGQHWVRRECRWEDVAQRFIEAVFTE